MPLNITSLLGQSAAPNLKQSHCHPRPDFGQLDGLPPRAYEHVVAHLNTVVHVPEGHHTTADLLIRGGGFARGEEVLEDLHDSFSERGGEIVEYEVRV